MNKTNTMKKINKWMNSVKINALQKNKTEKKVKLLIRSFGKQKSQTNTKNNKRRHILHCHYRYMD